MRIKEEPNLPSGLTEKQKQEIAQNSATRAGRLRKKVRDVVKGKSERTHEPGKTIK